MDIIVLLRTGLGVDEGRMDSGRIDGGIDRSIGDDEFPGCHEISRRSFNLR